MKIEIKKRSEGKVVFSGDFESLTKSKEEKMKTLPPLERMRRKLKDFVQENDVSEDYLAGISRQMFDTHPSNLDAPKLNKLINAVCWLERRIAAGVSKNCARR